jgi:hypothetical protein
MNVALTRARHHLLIVGHSRTLQHNIIWKRVTTLAKKTPRGYCPNPTVFYSMLEHMHGNIQYGSNMKPVRVEKPLNVSDVSVKDKYDVADEGENELVIDDIVDNDSVFEIQSHESYNVKNDVEHLLNDADISEHGVNDNEQAGIEMCSVNSTDTDISQQNSRTIHDIAEFTDDDRPIAQVQQRNSGELTSTPASTKQHKSIIVSDINMDDIL